MFSHRNIVRSPLSAVRHSFATFATIILLSGCGGGGGTPSPTTTPAATPTPTVAPTPMVTPTPTPNPVPTPTPLPTAARERSEAANFLPNYVPTAPKLFLRWPDNKNIRVFVEPAVINVSSGAVSGSLSAEAAQRIARKAINAWQQNTDNDFRFVLVGTRAESQTQIYFADELRNMNNDVPPGVGITNWTYSFPNANDSQRAELTTAKIQVKTGRSEEEMVDTAAHELGHAIGITDHSTEGADIMYATSIPPANITQRDLNTTFYLYYSPTAVAGRATKPRAISGVVHSGEIVCGEK